MSDHKTIWQTDVPAEIQSLVEPYLRDWTVLVPTWCHYLKVFWDQRDSSNQAKATPRMEYREADICICPPWLELTSSEREAAIVHELLHLQLEPLQNVATDMLNSLKKKSAEVYRWADEQTRYSRESVVSDLLHAVLSLRSVG